MTETKTQPQPILRADYRAPAYTIGAVDLHFDLDERATTVRAVLQVRRVGSTDEPLVLHGEELELLSLRVDGDTLPADRYVVDEEHLTISELPAACELQTEVRINPADNTMLSGLYVSSGNFCTQCEAEGFRRITYFLDRPDVMACYTTTVEGDASRYPVMLSNGNRIEEVELESGRKRVRWEDPFPKPSYLFALVAGKLTCLEGTFTTCSGREVRLEIWVEPQNIDSCEHALRCLRRAMEWDEQVFGREYDLDLYMIVAVGDFNMGAMENKGLNIFNSKYVLARPETATDDDYEGVEGVIGHEYFHNWTGNRITCRDWFQLTLKEGLTVFRDQQFSADMTSAPVKRISDVKRLRGRQLPEDAGPTAHPIRPESYVEMDNFYTATVYEKGAEVVRMMHTLLGVEGFRRGMDLYFERHDGQAVTCDDFRAALGDANGRDLGQFERWYSQAGTAGLSAVAEWRADEGVCALTLRQAPPRGRSAEESPALHMPVRVGLVGPDGIDLPLVLEGEGPGEAPRERVLELTEREQTWTFTGLEARPVPSILRGFSAPVILCADRSQEDLAFLLANDSDAFNRWDAGQALFGAAILSLASGVASNGASGWALERALELDPLLVDAFRAVLLDPGIDGSIRALTLTFPSERELGQQMQVIDPDALHEARRFLVREVARALRGELLAVYDAHRSQGPYAADKASIDRRRTRNRALAYLSALEQPETTALAWTQFRAADNMADSQAALACLAAVEAPERERALSAFRERWKDDPLVMDKWFQVQAESPLPGAVERVRELSRHSDFSLANPNRARSLIVSFSVGNQAGFHDPSGAGYAFLADHVLAIDPKNPQLAAACAKAFVQWRRYDERRRGHAEAQLRRISEAEGLSRNTYEIVEMALEG